MQAGVALWRNMMTGAQLAAEAQTVIALRLAGGMGLWTLPEHEGQRMVMEKPMAFAEAGLGAWYALLRGHGWDVAGAAFARPLLREARRNRRRLGRRRARAARG